MLKNDLELELEKVILKKYGRTAKELRQDEKFNIWDAYTLLKAYTGISKRWFSPEEFNKKIKAIQNVLGV